MKVRFTSPKEQQPTTDDGLKVIYAPAKRVAYRIRWYLILLLVSSPVLWFLGTLLGGMLLLEAPAHTLLPLTEVRALESGRVHQLHVRSGDRVAAGSLLVQLESPTLMTQQRLLQERLSSGLPGSLVAPQQHRLLLEQSERAGQRVLTLERLLARGAATRGELDAARDLYAERLAAVAELERLQSPRRLPDEALQRSELALVEQRLQQLDIRTEAAALVHEVYVHAGEAVGPGTLLLQLRSQGEPAILVYLDARQRQLARPGQPLRLRMPDHQWLEARVSDIPPLTGRVPAALRAPFDNASPGLILHVEPLEPLPARWQLDNLPLTARFPNALQRWWQQRQAN